MTIRSLELTNFRQHRKRKFRFSPTVTTIVGPSRKGKTAIIRALKHLCFNRPAAGKGLIRWGQKGFSVRAQVDGKHVSRSRKGSKNLYKVDEQKYIAFGSDVPKQVSDLLNVSEVNFQYQIDSPFWITESAGKLSKKLNEVVNLAEIDRILSISSSKVRKSKVEVELVKEDHKKSNAARKLLKFVPQLSQDLNALVKLEKRLKRIRLRSSVLADLVDNCVKLQSGRDNANKARAEAAIALETLSQTLKTQKRRRSLSNLIKGLKSSQIVLEVELPDFSQLEEIRKQGDATAEHRRGLSALIDETKEHKEQLCLIEQNLEAKERNLKKKGKNIVCPTCGNRLRSSSLISTSH